MHAYDPRHDPDPAQWLALDESDRVALVRAWHEADATAASPDSPATHAAMHVVVENQIAANHAPTVQAMARLLGEGLSRHEAVHAIGAVLIAQIWRALRDPDHAGDIAAACDAQIAQLSAAAWRERQ